MENALWLRSARTKFILTPALIFDQLFVRSTTVSLQRLWDLVSSLEANGKIHREWFMELSTGTEG